MLDRFREWFYSKKVVVVNDVHPQSVELLEQKLFIILYDKQSGVALILDKELDRYYIAKFSSLIDMEKINRYRVSNFYEMSDYSQSKMVEIYNEWLLKNI